jgi:hypothetical protein
MRLTESEIKKLAAAYDLGVDQGESPAVQAWAREQAGKVHREFRQLEQKIAISFTERDPYRNFEELAHDVRVNRRMFVYQGGSDTPLWDAHTNWMARAVHDWDHVQGSFDFSVEGEIGAYKYAAARAPALAKLYLSEIALQAASSAIAGFPDGPQKVVLASDEIIRLADSFSPNGKRKLRAGSKSAIGRREALRTESLALVLASFLPPEDIAVHLGALAVPRVLGIAAAASTKQVRPDRRARRAQARQART